jgi:hypothetical protein
MSFLTGIAREHTMRTIYVAQSCGRLQWITPAAYWQHFLYPKLMHLLQTRNRSLRSEDTSVVVSVTDRKDHDLTKWFDDTTIDWAVIERQLVAWGELYRASKKLRLNLSFNYVDTSHSSTTSLGRAVKEAPHLQLGRCLPKEMRKWMQNTHLLDRHLFGRRYITLCVVRALHVIWDLIAGVALLVKSITNWNRTTWRASHTYIASLPNQNIAHFIGRPQGGTKASPN